MKTANRHSMMYLPALFLGVLVVAGCQSSPTQKQADADAKALEAQDEFQKAANREPTPNTFYAMARILAAQQRETESQAILHKIIATHPDYLPAYNDLAESQIRQRQIDAAVGTLQAGLKQQPQQAILLNNLGMCSLINGQYGDALNWFTQAAGRDPNDSRYRANMATALGMLGRYDEALNLYTQIGPAADAHYNIGVLAEARKDRDRATQEFTQARQLKAPENSPRLATEQ